MYSSVLSVLLMGMLPWVSISALESAPLKLAIAPPTPLAADAEHTLTQLRSRLSASGVLLVDLQSGQTIFSRSPRQKRPFASLAKLMTALIILENHRLDEVVTIPAESAKAEGHVVKLPPGERFTVGDLLEALLVDSANDAAIALALFHRASLADFADEMNQRAQILGLQDTTFTNPAGFDHPGQLSTARDLSWLMMFVLRHPELRDRMSVASSSIESVGGHVITLQNTHELLGVDDRIVAGKTGTTLGAGQCLISVVEKDGREYLAILLSSRERYRDMRFILQALDSLLI